MLKGFGTFKGVFIPSTEAILGTVLFLLLPALAADVGLFTILGIIILSHTVTVATTFSLADCATNLSSIGGGGMYALSKKSLGKAFGGSIGIQLYIAQAASIGFYCIGFAEPVQPILGSFMEAVFSVSAQTPGGILLQKQIIATIVFILFFSIVMMGADFTLKIQLLILFILFGSIAAIFISPFLNIEFNSTGLFVTSLNDLNLYGNRPLTMTVFFLTFTQFFPAVTGIDAGVGMSGELREPGKSLIRGTFSAIGVTFVVYIISAFIFSGIKKGLLIKGYSGGTPIGNLLTDLLGFNNSFPENLPGIMIITGILFATSSSALSCFMTAPRTAQSLSKDRVLPDFMSFLGRDFRKKGKEPRYATLVTFFVGLSIIWTGNINTAAMIVGICYLVVYGWLNGSAFLERASRNPSFRPTFRGHWAVSLYGSLSCIFAIMLFSWYIGIIIIISQFFIFRSILKHKTRGRIEGVWWGVIFSLVSSGLKKLKKIIQGAKNWRPIVTVIAFHGDDNSPKNIAHLSDIIASYKGMVNLNIMRNKDVKHNGNVGKGMNIHLKTIETDNPTESILGIIQASHPGGIEPNTIMLEYTRHVDTVKIIMKVLAMERNILLVKNGEKFKKPEVIDVWWRGERNGNFMILLAHIIMTSYMEEAGKSKIRIIRKLDMDGSEDEIHKETAELLEEARLSAEIVVLPFSEKPFQETLHEVSGGSDLVMMGIPGNYTEKESGFLFKINEFFFNKEIELYSKMPTVIFLKSARVINLAED